MIDIGRLNINVGGGSVSGFSGEHEIVAELEARIGRKVPDVYLAFLREADGGCPQIGCFHANVFGVDEVFEVNNFFSLANPDVERVVDEVGEWGCVLGEGALPIARDGGGNIVYIDLNSESEQVWLYLCVEDERVPVSSSFESFVSGLFSEL